jgi:hypothetical protein
MAGDLVNPDGTPWVAQFEGQRSPFQPGNSLAVTHGAYSKTRTDPIARRFIEEVYADPATAFLNAHRYSAMLWQWAVLMAQCELISAAMDGMTFEEASESDRGKTSPMDLLTRFSGKALALADRLGLTPRSYAALGKTITSTQRDLASLLSDPMATDGPTPPPL